MGATHVEVYSDFLREFPPSRLKFRPATQSWEFEGKASSVGELVRLIAYELDHSNQRIANMLARAAYDARNAAWAQIRSWLSHIEGRPRDDTMLRAWLRSIERSDTEPMMHEANVVAMKQWIWQVKRGVLQLPVIWHVAPIFWSSENGTGKSYNVKRLYKPLAAFARNLDVNDIGERFSGPLMSETLIGFLDEFAGVEQANAAQLKAILTGKDIDARSMHSEAGFHAKNRLSCIATSNMAPPHGFIDHTGARRFWSIHCSGEQMTQGSQRMSQFDAMDIDAIWCSIGAKDESPQYTTDKPVLDFMADVREQRLRSKTSLEQFCGECLERSAGDRLTLKEFQGNYKMYCAQTRQNPVRGGYRSMSELLTALGFVVVNRSNRFYLKDHVMVDFETTVD